MSVVFHPSGQSLLVAHDAKGRRVQFHLDVGVLFHHGDQVRQIAWSEVLSADNPHEMVREVEQAAGFGVPTTTPDTSDRALVYRLVARFLAMQVDDRHNWSAVPLPLIEDGTALPDSTQHVLGRFITATDSAHAYLDQIAALAGAPGPQRYWHEPLWALQRDGETTVVLDEAGVAHLSSGLRLELMDMYDAFRRTTQPLAAFLLLDRRRTLALSHAMTEKST